MAILELTKQNLQELNFEKEHIKKLLTWNEYGMHLSNEVFACSVNRKIYTEKDYYTRTYNENSKPIFPFRILELIPDYYDACLKQFLNAKQKLLGKIFNELLEKNEFIKSQINESEEIINYYSDRYKNSLEKFEKFPTVVGRKAYKVWLENLPPQQTETKTNEINTFRKSMPLSIPKEHFIVFTDKKSKNGKPFLTTEQYNKFIERAFCGNRKLPKQKFNQSPKGEKLIIQKVFYEFYNNYCMDYFNTMQCQNDFIKLLTDNFTGWEFKNVKNNFTPKTKKQL